MSESIYDSVIISEWKLKCTMLWKMYRHHTYKRWKEQTLAAGVVGIGVPDAGPGGDGLGPHMRIRVFLGDGLGMTCLSQFYGLNFPNWNKHYNTGTLSLHYKKHIFIKKPLTNWGQVCEGVALLSWFHGFIFFAAYSCCLGQIQADPRPELGQMVWDSKGNQSLPRGRVEDQWGSPLIPSTNKGRYIRHK